jgi:hypothetical protein
VREVYCQGQGVVIRLRLSGVKKVRVGVKRGGFSK